jgi:hypothetical protein
MRMNTTDININREQEINTLALILMGYEKQIYLTLAF